MKKVIITILMVLLVGCTPANNTEPSSDPSVKPTETTVSEETADATTSASTPSGEFTGDNIEMVTSASIVPEEYVQQYEPKGFTDSEAKKALFIIGDPRNYSVTYDLANTAMKYLEENGIEVEVRDLYEIGFDPVLSADNFYYTKDGFGEPTEAIKVEQEYVTKTDYLIFVYPNWHDSENAIIKGYKELVFAKKFAYEDTEEGLKGKLTDKAFYTIMNAGYLGGGRGYIGDGVGISDDVWDEYMKAYQVFDNDTANFWGCTNLGRFVNDRTPSNTSEKYEEEINELRTSLTDHLNKIFLQ